MHLAVDALGIKHSGGATVLLDFLLVALADDRISKITVFCSPRPTRNFDLPHSSKMVECEQALAERSYIYRIWWFEHMLGRICRQRGVDVLLCMSGAGRLSSNARQVTFIQQSLPFSKECQASLSKADRFRFLVLKSLMRRSCISASKVIVQTNTMKTWICKDFGLPNRVVDVVMPSIDLMRLKGESSSAPNRLGSVPGPRLLYVGNQSPYKNVEILVSGMPQLRRVIPEATLFLTWPANYVSSRIPGVVCLDYLSGDALAQAYRQATLLVMPSLVETVGLPMLEAMSVGTPVLAADRPYAHDVCEDAAVFFDPLSVDDFVSVATRVLQSSECLVELSAKGRKLVARRSRSKPYFEMLNLILAANT